MITALRWKTSTSGSDRTTDPGNWKEHVRKIHPECAIARHGRGEGKPSAGSDAGKESCPDARGCKSEPQRRDVPTVECVVWAALVGPGAVSSSWNMQRAGACLPRIGCIREDSIDWLQVLARPAQSGDGRYIWRAPSRGGGGGRGLQSPTPTSMRNRRDRIELRPTYGRSVRVARSLGTMTSESPAQPAFKAFGTDHVERVINPAERQELLAEPLTSALDLFSLVGMGFVAPLRGISFGMCRGLRKSSFD